MTDKFRTHHIILVISSSRGIISVAIGGSGSRGTYEVTIRIVIIVVFRISTTVVVVAFGIIIDVIFGFFVIGINDSVIVIFGIAFGYSIKIRIASGEGTVIIHSRMKKMMIVAFEIIINVIFGIVIYREGPTRPPVRIIIVVDEAKGPIIVERRIVVVVVKVVFVFGIIFVVVFEIVIVVVVVIVEFPTLLCLILRPAVGIIIVGVDKAKGPIISGVRDLDDTAVGTVIVML